MYAHPTGRGKIYLPELCPDPDWPKDSNGNYKDGAYDNCWVGAARATRSADGQSDGYLRIQDATTALCNVAVNSWGDRAEMTGLRAFDVTRGGEFLGQSFLKDSLVQVFTANSANGWSEWPFPGWNDGSWKNRAWWDTPAIKGFEW